MPGGEEGGAGPQGSGATRARRTRAGRGSGARRTASPKRAAPRQGELLPDGKLYYRIGEVAKITGVKAHVLRYWETEFRWMSPPKSRSKQRLYRRRDIEMILVIKRLLYEERYTIAGARQQLRELGLAKALEAGPGADANASPGEAGDAGNDPVVELRAGYRQIRAELESIRALL
jgi:DNA-binding transcriptional MerR regulator